MLFIYNATRPEGLSKVTDLRMVDFLFSVVIFPQTYLKRHT